MDVVEAVGDGDSSSGKADHRDVNQFDTLVVERPKWLPRVFFPGRPPGLLRGVGTRRTRANSVTERLAYVFASVWPTDALLARHGQWHVL